MRQQHGHGAGGEHSSGGSLTSQSAGGSIGKRTLVEQAYAQGGASPVQLRPGSVDTSAASTADEAFPHVAEIVGSGIDAAALRRILAAKPSLADEIVGYLAAQGDSRLNALMAAAFPATTTSATTDDAEPSTSHGGGEGATFTAGGEKSEKQPTDPTQALPAPRSGNKARRNSRPSRSFSKPASRSQRSPGATRSRTKPIPPSSSWAVLTLTPRTRHRLTGGRPSTNSTSVNSRRFSTALRSTMPISTRATTRNSMAWSPR